MQIEVLQGELNDAMNEKNEFTKDCDEKIARIVELEAELESLVGEQDRLRREEEERRRREEEDRKNRTAPIKVKYIPVKGDRVDELMAAYMNNFELDVPIQRLGEGNYMFGSRKIYAKIMNDKLVIRVGGGYMLIDEFLATYGQQELDKMMAMQNNTGYNALAMGSPKNGGRRSPGMVGKTLATGVQNQMRAANNRGSPNNAGRKSPNSRFQ